MSKYPPPRSEAHNVSWMSSTPLPLPASPQSQIMFVYRHAAPDIYTRAWETPRITSINLHPLDSRYRFRQGVGGEALGLFKMRTFAATRMRASKQRAINQQRVSSVRAQRATCCTFRTRRTLSLYSAIDSPVREQCHLLHRPSSRASSNCSQCSI